MTLECTWQSLFVVMECVLEASGDNDYCLPHCAKEPTEKCGKLEWKVLVKWGLIRDPRKLRDVGIHEWVNFLTKQKWFQRFVDVLFSIMSFFCGCKIIFILMFAFLINVIYFGTREAYVIILIPKFIIGAFWKINVDSI